MSDTSDCQVLPRLLLKQKFTLNFSGSVKYFKAFYMNAEYVTKPQNDSCELRSSVLTLNYPSSILQSNLVITLLGLCWERLRCRLDIGYNLICNTMSIIINLLCPQEYNLRLGCLRNEN